MTFGKKMQRLTYLRIGTYTLLLAILFLARERRYFIPVPLQGSEVAYEGETSRSLSLLRARLHAELPTRPGFENTRLSGGDLLRLAREYAAREKIDLTAFLPPVISLHSEGDRLKWSMHFEQKLPMPGGFFGLGIDDLTGEIEMSPGI